MQDKTLIRLSLAVSTAGLLALFILQGYAELYVGLDDSPPSSDVRISGEVLRLDARGKVTELYLMQVSSACS